MVDGKEIRTDGVVPLLDERLCGELVELPWVDGRLADRFLVVGRDPCS